MKTKSQQKTKWTTQKALDGTVFLFKNDLPYKIKMPGRDWKYM